jgi:hypothetical protein
LGDANESLIDDGGYVSCFKFIWARLRKNARGETVCGNGRTAAAANPNTRRGAAAHKNSNGVTTTQTNSGGKAKTKNGMRVAQGPNGKTCAKGKYEEGCTK